MHNKLFKFIKMSDNRNPEAIVADKISIACNRMHDAINEFYEGAFNDDGTIRTDFISSNVTQLRKILRIEIDFAIASHEEFLNEQPS